MSLSLKDQLIAAGLVKKDDPSAPKPKPHQPASRSPQAKATHKPAMKPAHSATPAKSKAESDLAQAWKARQRQEQADRDAQKRAAEEKARIKKERQQKLQQLLAGKALLAEGADVVRHFQYGKKITRIYLTPEQVQALAKNEIGIAQFNGRFAVYPATVMQELRAFEPALIAVFEDIGLQTPDAPSEDSPYADEKFQVPDDLRW